MTPAMQYLKILDEFKIDSMLGPAVKADKFWRELENFKGSIKRKRT
jgi:hypothetical protein